MATLPNSLYHNGLLPQDRTVTTNNPAQDLLNRLQSQFGEPLTEAAETIVERFLAPFALVPKHDFEKHLETLQALEQTIEQLTTRVAELEAKASKKSGKKKSSKKKSARKKDSG